MKLTENLHCQSFLNFHQQLIPFPSPPPPLFFNFLSSFSSLSHLVLISRPPLSDLAPPSLLFIFLTSRLPRSHLLTSPSLSSRLFTFQFPKVSLRLLYLHFLVSPPFFIILHSSPFFFLFTALSHLIFPV